MEAEKRKIWDANTRQLINSIPLERNIQYAAWSPDGTYIALATDREGDETTQIWRVDGKEPRFRLYHSNVVNYLAWDPTGTRLATARQNKQVKI